MKALTVWQPWASLILIGAKPYEFRSWKPPQWLVGQRLAIHAGARKPVRREVHDLIARLEAGLEPTPCLHPEPALALLYRVRQQLEGAQSTLFGGAVVEPFSLPLSCVVATVRVGKPKRGDLCAREFSRWKGKGVRSGNDSDRVGHFNWGWPMLDVEPVMPHVETRGAQGLWDWREEAAA